MVLAGGGARRLGQDKARLMVDGQSLAGLAARRLEAVCSRVVIADAGKGVLAGWPSVPDGPGRGPAAGILGAAGADPESPFLVLGCDLPRISVELLRHLLELGAEGWDWVVPRHRQRLEPLCSFYGRRALDTLARQVRNGQLALHALADAPLRTRFVETSELAQLGDPDHLFFNLNTPQDLQRFLSERPTTR